MSRYYFSINQKKLFQALQRINHISFRRECKYFHTFQCNNCLFRNCSRDFRQFRISTTRAHKFHQNVCVFKRFFSNNQTKTNKKFKKSEILKLLSLAKPERWNILGAVCLLLISSGVTMAVPYSLGKVLDIIYSAEGGTPKESADKLNKVCAILIGVFAVGALANFGRVYIMSCAGYRVTQTLRKDVFRSILRQEQQFFDVRSTGELVNRLSADAQLVGQALSGNLSDGLRSLFAVLAGSGMMVYTSPELAAVGLSVVPPIALMAVVYGRFVRNITRSVQDGLASGSTLAEEKISNIRTVKMFAREPFEQKSYAEKMDRVLSLGYRESLARAGFYGAAGLAGNSIVIGVLYYGGSMITESHSITLGSLSAFLMYAAYIGISVGGLTRFYTEMNRSMGAASRLWELIERQPRIPYRGGLIPETDVLGRVTFENVKFGYLENQPVLEDVHLDIKPGQTVAVVGSSGSGKSTLASLLLRLYEPTSGNVLLDGMDVRDLDPSWLRTHIGTVSQEPVLFSGTIRDNILYGADDPLNVTDQQLDEALNEANLTEFIGRLPKGLDTEIGERGLTLSGGQRQRIAIARALIKRPHILLLDEATSALDSKSEFLVREALERVTKNRTVLTIAHRLSTIRNADTIAVLEGGKIVETGRYEDLLRKPEGKFKDLVMHQTFKDLT